MEAQETKIVGYKIIDRKTGDQVGGIYKDGRRASRRVDQLDNQYGGYRYSRQPIYA